MSPYLEGSLTRNAPMRTSLDDQASHESSPPDLSLDEVSTTSEAKDMDGEYN